MGIIEKIKGGEIPDHIIEIAKTENLDIQVLSEKIISGTVVVPKNNLKILERPCGIGEGARVKVNANIGTSEDFPEVENELEKLKTALEAGTDTIMDLSTGGDVIRMLDRIIESSPVPVGTVPVYEAALKGRTERGSLLKMTKEDMFKAVERQAEAGVDFMTIHSGINSEALNTLQRHPRLAGVVSRGGSFLLAWMLHNGRENPYFEDFGRLLEVLKKYDITLSLGDGLRPGCVKDATDKAQIQELLTLGRLTENARKDKVQVMVEGPGHVPIDQIETNIKLQKSVCGGAPFYVLGPLVTDIAPGYDHITAAIGGALAAYYGADFLCYVTPREHIGLPDKQDVREGVVASRIAAHAADLARGNGKAAEWDHEISKARKGLDWEKQIELSIDPEKTEKMLKERKSLMSDACSMCGEFCAMKLLSSELELENPGKC